MLKNALSDTVNWQTRKCSNCTKSQASAWMIINSSRRNSRGEQKNFHTLRIFVSLRGLMTWKVMQRNVWSDVVSYQIRRLNNSTKVSTPCIDDHHFEQEEMKSVGELPQVCSQIVLKCLYMARIVRPDILWSINKLARSVTKWTQACGRRLAMLISYIHHTNDFRQVCHVGNATQHCRLGLFQD